MSTATLPKNKRHAMLKLMQSISLARGLVGVGVIALSCAAILQFTPHSWWTTPLAFPSLIAEPNRHTPLFTQGTFLPPVIKKDRVFTEKDSPVILTGTSLVNSGVHITFEPGTELVAHEFGLLDVHGILTITGTKEKPVVFTTNETHPINKVWGGIVLRPESSGSISYASFAYAAPTISCFATHRFLISNSFITTTPVGILPSSSSCMLENTVIRAWQNTSTTVH